MYCKMFKIRNSQVVSLPIILLKVLQLTPCKIL